MKEAISIIGAGIGGLTTALSLKNIGVEVAVFESTPVIKPVGAGIVIANNAMQVYKNLGLETKIENAGNKISCIKITDQNLNEISVSDLSPFKKKYGVGTVAIHRAELQRILAEEVGYDKINLSKRLAKIEKDEAYKMTFEDDTIVESDVIIGADGIRSIVRDQLFEKSRLRNAEQICWRGVCEMDLPVKFNNEAIETWGKGKRFGFVKISDKKVYWFAVINAKNLISPEVDLTELFQEFHKDILTIISETPKEQIIINDILDLKPINKWQNGKVCLVGDAAHATTPNLGQGACQAVEDAYVLGKLLERGLPVIEAFQQYENIRRKKARKVVNTSWRLGKIAQLENSLLITSRNWFLKQLPASVTKKQMDMIFKLAEVRA
ncbi:MAG: FAD-dependent monooxygenase [Aequorivita sp.]